MKKKTKGQYIIDLINKIERSVVDLEQRTKFDLYPVTGLSDEVQRYKETIYKIYGGR